MHGVRKGPPPPPEKVAARRKKAATYAALLKHALAAKQANKHDSETYAVVEKLLLASPDVPTLWNYRREMLLAREATTDGSLDADETRAELALTQKCLMKQPKSYAAWHHRLWIVRRRPALAKDELALCAEFLKLDERNFHCWNYRRMVAELAGETIEDTRAFARDRLQVNFSNYSAHHALAKTLPSSMDAEAAREELATARQALFCEPDDQSTWWFSFDVLRRSNHATVDEEIAALEELRSLEPSARWPRMALLRLRLARGGPGDAEAAAELRDALVASDPDHAGMYGAELPEAFFRDSSSA